MNRTTTSNGRKQFTPEQLRKAATALVDPEAHGLDESFTAIPKGVVAALLEDAFSEAPTRGLAYPDEISDIADWLTRRAANYESQPDRWEILLATGAAWAANYAGDEPGPRIRALVRAVAAYFLHSDVETAADVASWEDDADGGDDEEGGAS
jgi:hypothetical protein